MACSYCNFTGIIISSYFANNKENRSIKMCPKCEDIHAYSFYVKSMYGSPFLKKAIRSIPEQNASEENNNILYISEYLEKNGKSFVNNQKKLVTKNDFEEQDNNILYISDFLSKKK